MSHEGQQGVLIHSGGCRMIGTLFLAWGDEPKPTVLLLHGLPGIEKNYDLAFALRDHGWNSLIFHYRGCGGSEGAFTIQGLPEDARAAVDELCSGLHAQVDPDRISLIGHSMGGWTAVREAASDPRIKAVAVLGAAADPAALPFGNRAIATGFTDFLQNITPESFISQWNALGPEDAALAQVDRLAPRPLLIIHGAEDDVVPVAQAHALHDRAPHPRELIIHPEATHSFTRHRPWLREQVLSWVSSLEATVLL